MAQDIPLQFRFGAGVRTLVGDERAYEFSIPRGRGSGTFIENNGPTFIKDELAFGLYFASETRMDFPLHASIDVDVAFGTEDHIVVGIGGGLGYNLDLGNGLYLQPKIGMSYVMSFRDMGTLPNTTIGGEEYGYLIGSNPTEMFDPQIDVTTTFLMVRPELNAFFRIHPSIFLFGGLGYQLPISKSDISFMFTGEDFRGDSFSESLKSNSPAINFKLGDEQNPKTSDASPQGFVVNIGVAYHL
jgi:hypothetical protein